MKHSPTLGMLIKILVSLLMIQLVLINKYLVIIRKFKEDKIYLIKPVPRIDNVNPVVENYQVKVVSKDSYIKNHLETMKYILRSIKIAYILTNQIMNTFRTKYLEKHHNNRYKFKTKIKQTKIIMNFLHPSKNQIITIKDIVQLILCPKLNKIIIILLFPILHAILLKHMNKIYSNTIL